MSLFKERISSSLINIPSLLGIQPQNLVAVGKSQLKPDLLHSFRDPFASSLSDFNSPVVTKRKRSQFGCSNNNDMLPPPFKRRKVTNRIEYHLNQSDEQNFVMSGTKDLEEYLTPRTDSLCSTLGCGVISVQGQRNTMEDKFIAIMQKGVGSGSFSTFMPISTETSFPPLFPETVLRRSMSSTPSSQSTSSESAQTETFSASCPSSSTTTEPNSIPLPSTTAFSFDTESGLSSDDLALFLSTNNSAFSVCQAATTPLPQEEEEMARSMLPPPSLAELRAKLKSSSCSLLSNVEDILNKDHSSVEVMDTSHSHSSCIVQTHHIVEESNKQDTSSSGASSVSYSSLHGKAVGRSCSNPTSAVIQMEEASKTPNDKETSSDDLVLSKHSSSASINTSSSSSVKTSQTNVCDIPNNELSLRQRYYMMPAFFGIYDGHGGDQASTFASKHLHKNIAQHPCFWSDTEKAIREGFLKTEREFLDLALENNYPDGTTAIVALLKHNRLYIANTGDSQAVLCHRGQPRLLTKPHNLFNPREVQRVKDAGGVVTKTSSLGHPVWNPNLIYINVTRAIGDIYFKHPKFVGTELVKRPCSPSSSTTTSTTESSSSSSSSATQMVEVPKSSGLIADPEIEVTVITQQDQFLILACDGLWDVVHPSEAVLLVQEKLAKGFPTKEAAKSLSGLATMRGSKDNITIVIITF